MDNEENIEKIIETTIVSDMKYVKSKAVAAKNKKDKVPEIVLPKTIAQLNCENTDSKAVTEKVSASPSTREEESAKTLQKSSIKKSASAVKTANKKDEIGQFHAGKTYESKLDRIQNLKKLVDSPKMIGSAEEIIPFSWRNPMKIQKGKKVSKVLKVLSKEEHARELLLPVKSDN